MENERKFLIDTEIFIWWMENNKRLRKDIYAILNAPENQIFLSVASIWEMVIKKGKKKLKVPEDIEKDIQKVNIVNLRIEAKHVLQIQHLPHIHSDPFDRLLIAQAQSENVTLITSDDKIWKYNLSLLKVT